MSVVESQKEATWRDKGRKMSNNKIGEEEYIRGHQGLLQVLGAPTHKARPALQRVQILSHYESKAQRNLIREAKVVLGKSLMNEISS